jgi:hypothetical protein
MNLQIIRKEILEIISNKQKELNLSFIEDTHTYFMNDINGNLQSNFPSVSTVLKKFYTPFPEFEKSLQKAKGCPIRQKEILLEWKGTADYATNMGSRVHFLLEKYLVDLYGSYKDIRQPIFSCDDNQVFIGDNMIKAGHEFIELMHSRGAVLLDTEIVLGCPHLGYTGQPDKVWLFDKNGELGLICTDWKGLPLDTLILTGTGWKTMGTLDINDKVYDKDGNLVNIKHISGVKNKKCLKIIFDNKEEVISDFEHRWLVFTETCGKKYEKVMTTQEIKDYNDNLNPRNCTNILKIENPKPLNNLNIELPIDPYVLGVWLGDGHQADGKITQANEKVWNEIKKRGYEIGNDVSGGCAGLATTRTIFGLSTYLRKLNLLKDKHVPDIYLLSSYEQRLDLLRGLMDADGYYHKTRKRFILNTTREQQADFCIKIISSLGLKTTLLKYKTVLNSKTIQCFTVQFTTTEINPFLSRNEIIDSGNIKNSRTYRTIKSVEEVDSVPTKCIEVDSPSNTYLFSRSLIVTHNTNKPKNFESHWFTIPMLKPFEQYDDTALSHYYLQLPFYVRLLLQMLKGSKYENISFFGGMVLLLKEDATYKEYRIPKDIITKVFDLDIKNILQNNI